MLMELLLAATLSGQELFTQEVCLAENAAQGQTETWDEAGCLTRWIYAPGVLETLNPFGDDLERIFSREAVAAIRAAWAATPDGYITPGFDADPFCNCQDPYGLMLLINVTTAPTETEATSTVRFAFRPDGMTEEAFVEVLTPDRVTERLLVLVREADGWRVDDIQSADGYSFRDSIQP